MLRRAPADPLPSAGELRTERLVLRPVAPHDVDDYARLYADPEVVRFIGDGTTSTRDEAADWVRRALDRNARAGFDMRSVFLLDGTFVGRCGIAVWKVEGRRERELGWVLAREHWHLGYATEAAIAMRDHAMGALGHRRLIALIRHGNAASESVATKVGMAYERDVVFHDRPVQLFSTGS